MDSISNSESHCGTAKVCAQSFILALVGYSFHDACLAFPSFLLLFAFLVLPLTVGRKRQDCWAV